MQKRRLRTLATMGLALLSLPSLYAQANPQQVDAAEPVLSLNRQILGRSASFRSRQEASSLLTERARALEALIVSNPAKAQEAALPEAALESLRAAYPALRESLEVRGQWQGQAEYLISDDFANSSSQSFIRIREGAKQLDVHFADVEPAELQCGDQLSVQGVRLGDHIAASSSTLLESTLEAANSCSPIGEQRIAVLMVKFPGLPTPNLTTQQMYDSFFSSSVPSLSGYWQDASYGKTSVVGDVFGWYTLDRAYTCDESGALRDAAMQASDSDVYFPNYNRIFIVFPRPLAGCSFGGLGTVGCNTTATPSEGNILASVSWLIAEDIFKNAAFDRGLYLAAHEGGHNLGLRHASSRDYGSLALGPPGDLGVHGEYGDLFSVMGASSDSYGHYSARHKLQLGWLNEISEVETVENSGTFVVQPLSSWTPGRRALRVRRSADQNAWLWVEYRQPIGLYDSEALESVFGGALVHIEDENNLTGSGTLNAGKTHLLDFTPGSPPTGQDIEEAVLPTGGSWQDPFSSRSLSVLGASSDGLLISVNESPPCVTLDSESEDFDYHAASGAVSISAPLDCSWAVLVSSSWISVTSATSGQGSALLTYNIAASSAQLPRSGIISVGRAVLNISQGGVPVGPSADSVTPSAGSGGDPVFELRFSDGNGADDLSILGFIINTSPTAVQGCRVEVAPADGTVRLANDAGNGWLGPVPINPPSTLANSRCRLRWAVLPPAQGTTRQLYLAFQFTTAFTTNANVYLYAEDMAGFNTGWQSRGTWTVPVNQTPSAIAATPNAASGYHQQISFAFSDLNGADDLRRGFVYYYSASGQIIPGSAPQCGFQFTLRTSDNPVDQLYFLSQNGASTTLLYFGSSGTFEHGICGVNSQHSSVTRSGTQLTVRLDVFFKPGSEGIKQVYTLARDSFQQSSAWQQLGTWTVGPSETEVTVFRQGAWLPFQFATGQPTSGVWTGKPSPGCIPLRMDYDGDAVDEFTQFCNGAWHFYNDDGSYLKSIWTGGAAGDVPAPADYDGGGTDDVVVFRNGAWLFFDFATGAMNIARSRWTGAPAHWLGGKPAPVPMDYDGDGTADFTVYSGGPWHFYNDNGSYLKGIWTGAVAGDIPVPGNYHGLNSDEVVVFRNGAWLVFDFGTGQFQPGSSVWTGRPAYWNGGTSMPAPVDYDGDGTLDFTVYSGGPWHFYTDTGAYDKGIWTGGVAGDVALSARPVIP